MKKEVEMEFQREFNVYIDEAERRKTLLFEGRRKKWRNKINQLEKSYAKRLEEIKEKCTDGAYPMIRDDFLDNNYTSQMHEMKNDMEKIMKEMDQVKNHKLDEIFCHQKDTLEIITNDQLKKKEEWTQKRKLELHSNLKDDMAVIEIAIRNDRDREINTLIHSNYELEEGFEKSFRERKKEQEKSTDKKFIETVKHLNEKNDLMTVNLERVSQKVDGLRIEYQNILERLETKENALSKIKRGILVLKQACERLESSQMSINASIYEGIEEQNKQELCLGKRLRELEVAIHELDW